MKKPVLYILLLSGLLMAGCAETSTSDEDGDYINPGFDVKTVSANKGFLIDGNSGGGTSCQAIAFQGDVNNKEYVGLAVKDTSIPINIKIYWRDSSFPANVDLEAGKYIIKITNSSGTSSTVSGNLHLTRSNPFTGIYRYQFVDPLTVTGDAGTFNIAAGDYIAGYVY